MTHALCGNLHATAPQFIPGARLARDELVVMGLHTPDDSRRWAADFDKPCDSGSRRSVKTAPIAAAAA